MPQLLDSTAIPFLTLGLLIIGCIISSKLSSRFSMPCLLLFLLLGMGLHYVLGDGLLPGLDSTELEQLNEHIDWKIANSFGTMALAFILFSGGYDSSLAGIRKVLIPGTILSTAGVLLTALLLGGFVIVLFHHRIPEGMTDTAFFASCMLFGSIISSTDASAVFSILRSRKISLRGTLRPLLEYESGSNDPMATLLTLFFLGMYETVSGGGSAAGECMLFLPQFVWKMGIGVGVGIALSRAAIWLFNRLQLDYDGLYHVLGMGIVLVTYAAASWINANGFMAVYVAGIVMGNSQFVFKNSYGRFSDALAWLMQVLLFTMLGLKANPEILFNWKFAGWGLVMALFLMFVARPAATFLCLFKSSYSTRAKLLVSWVGLRGGAPIMLATFPLIINQSEWPTIGGGNFNVAEIMFNMIFFMVLLSVAFQSFTIMPLARLLHLDSPLKVVPTAPLAFDQVSFSRRKDDGGHADEDDYADNHPGEFTIPAGSDMVDKELRNLGLPEGVFVIMIRRNAKYIVPRGNTVIHEGDTMTVMGTTDRLREAAIFFNSTNSHEE